MLMELITNVRFFFFIRRTVYEETMKKNLRLLSTTLRTLQSVQNVRYGTQQYYFSRATVKNYYYVLFDVRRFLLKLDNRSSKPVPYRNFVCLYVPYVQKIVRHS